MVHVSLHRAMLTSTGGVYVACVQLIVRLQLVSVSVRIDHRRRVGMVHVSECPEVAKKTLIPFPREITVSNSPC